MDFQNDEMFQIEKMQISDTEFPIAPVADEILVASAHAQVLERAPAAGFAAAVAGAAASGQVQGHFLPMRERVDLVCDTLGSLTSDDFYYLAMMQDAKKRKAALASMVEDEMRFRETRASAEAAEQAELAKVRHASERSASVKIKLEHQIEECRDFFGASASAASATAASAPVPVPAQVQAPAPVQDHLPTVPAWVANELAYAQRARAVEAARAREHAHSQLRAYTERSRRVYEASPLAGSGSPHRLVQRSPVHILTPLEIAELRQRLSLR